MKLAIFGNAYQQCHLDSVASLLAAFGHRGFDLEVECDFLSYLASGGVAVDGLTEVGEDGPRGVDAALSIGGDGTFLKAAHWVAGTDTPVIGINAGHLGYLTTAGVDEADAVADDLLAGRYDVESRATLQVTADFPGASDDKLCALNEVAILRHDSSSMISMRTSVNGVELTTYKGDGLVVCTPTGSTAYNMSVGGPILDPMSSCLVLSPISPHSLSMRPIVIRDDTVVTVTTVTRARFFQASVDGNALLCPSGATVTITKSPTAIRMIQRRGRNFAETLRNKLNWGV